MQYQGLRWRGLATNQTNYSSNSNSNSNQNRSHGRKFTPTRVEPGSDNRRKIQLISNSNSKRTMMIDQEFQELESSRVINMNGISVIEYKNISPQKSQEQINSIRTPTEELSPTILKQLRQMRANDEQIKPAKVLFYSQKNHPHPNDELTKIQSEFANFKKDIMEEIAKYKKQIDSIVATIMAQLQEVLKACASVQSSTNQPNLAMKESICCENNELESLNLNLSTIKKEVSLQNSKAEGPMMLFIQDTRKQEKKVTSRLNKSLTQRPFKDAIKQRLNLDVQETRSKVASVSKSKKCEFDKLFQAMDQLKGDITDLHLLGSVGNAKRVSNKF